MSGRFNENTRVQVPAALHLCRLGYDYLDSIGEDEYEPRTNFLVKVFREAVARLNPGITEARIDALLSELVQAAKNDDLGREFFQKITATSGERVIDFNNPDNNSWHCTTEFTCEDPETHENFRPDITCFVNGCVSMPSNVFATTGTNVSVLFFDNSRKADKVVLIDASKLGEEYKDGNNQRKRLRDFEIQKIVDTFLDQKAEDGFSVVVSHDEIKAKGYTLSAGQYFDVKIEYVPITADEFAGKIAGFKSRLSELNAKGAELDREIARNLDSLKFNSDVGEN